MTTQETTTSRVSYSTWGSMSVGDGYAMQHDDETRVQSVQRSVTSKLRRQHGVSPWRFVVDSREVDRCGRTIKTHYVATVGTTCDGGMTPRGRIWVAVGSQAWEG